MSVIKQSRKRRQEESSTLTTEHAVEEDLSSMQFPWLDLPTELRVKILSEVPPQDLAKCRETSRGTKNLIERYKRLMKRRVIKKIEIEGEEDSDILRITVSLNQRSKKQFEFLPSLDENANATPNKRLRMEPLAEYSIPSTSRGETQVPEDFINRLHSFVKDSNVQTLELFELNLSHSLLNSILAVLQEHNSTLRTLDIGMCSVTDVNPEIFQKFITRLKPSELRLRWIRQSTSEHLNPKILEGRKKFEVSSITNEEGSPLYLSSLSPRYYLNAGCQSFHFDLSSQDQATKAIQELVTEQEIPLFGPFFFGIDGFKWCSRANKNHLEVKVDKNGVKITTKRQ